MTTQTSTTWCGWFRPRLGQWRKLASAASYADAWGALLEEINHLPPGDAVVLEGVRHPNDPTPTTRRRTRR